MAGRAAKDYQDQLARKLTQLDGLEHLRVRARGGVLTVESGPPDVPVPHVRFRRDTVHLWSMEMPVRGGRWQKTPFRGPLDELVNLVATDFSWTLAPELNPEGTTDL